MCLINKIFIRCILCNCIKTTRSTKQGTKLSFENRLNKLSMKIEAKYKQFLDEI